LALARDLWVDLSVSVLVLALRRKVALRLSLVAILPLVLVDLSFLKAECPVACLGLVAAWK
jgi:hypothetical protein